MALIEKVKELAEALNNSVYMPYENIIISAHDMNGLTHIEYCHADPFIATGHVCVMMDMIAKKLNIDRKAVVALILKTYFSGGDDLDEQADQGDDRRDTGTPAGDRE